MHDLMLPDYSRVTYKRICYAMCLLFDDRSEYEMVK